MRKSRSPSLEENTEVKSGRESSRREEEGLTKSQEKKATGRTKRLRAVTSKEEEMKKATVVTQKPRVVANARRKQSVSATGRSTSATGRSKKTCYGRNLEDTVVTQRQNVETSKLHPVTVVTFMLRPVTGSVSYPIFALFSSFAHGSFCFFLNFLRVF